MGKRRRSKNGRGGANGPQRDYSSHNSAWLDKKGKKIGRKDFRTRDRVQRMGSVPLGKKTLPFLPGGETDRNWSVKNFSRRL